MTLVRVVLWGWVAGIVYLWSETQEGSSDLELTLGQATTISTLYLVMVPLCVLVLGIGRLRRHPKGLMWWDVVGVGVSLYWIPVAAVIVVALGLGWAVVERRRDMVMIHE